LIAAELRGMNPERFNHPIVQSTNQPICFNQPICQSTDQEKTKSRKNQAINYQILNKSLNHLFVWLSFLLLDKTDQIHLEKYNLNPKLYKDHFELPC
jgi:hypothetical protein